jgi:hypothetical protein
MPRRPEHTEHLDESALAKLVTRDSMIGVSVPVFRPPSEASAMGPAGA